MILYILIELKLTSVQNVQFCMDDQNFLNFDVNNLVKFFDTTGNRS